MLKDEDDGLMKEEEGEQAREAALRPCDRSSVPGGGWGEGCC
jgi:hypothetical protein